MIAAGCALAAASAPLAAQEGARCFIEVRKLVTTPPAGIDELGGAIRRLDAALRPQVEEIKRLKREVAELRRANEILKSASVFFAKELDRPTTR